MHNDNYREEPFKYLKRKNGAFFSDEIQKNWYISRQLALELLNRAETKGIVPFVPNSKDHLEVVFDGDSPHMLSVVRQLALLTHYLNFNEEGRGDSRHRTVFIIISQKPTIKEELEKEEYLCNLPKYCSFVSWGAEPENKDSHIDVEIHIVSAINDDERTRNTIVVKSEEVESFFKAHGEDEDILKIDVRKAEYASRMYSLGTEFYNLPAEDIHSAKRYTLALDVFQYSRLKAPFKPMFTEDYKNRPQYELKETLSNVFCADCFESRKKAIKLIGNGDAKKEKELWAKNNEVLSKSEHARWVVEKLIMGYRPLSEKERYAYENLHVQFGGNEKKKAFRDQLKHNDQDPAHIDLCSYLDLRRVNPDDMKFDSFLMLAIPEILKKIKGQ